MSYLVVCTSRILWVVPTSAVVDQSKLEIVIRCVAFLAQRFIELVTTVS